MTPELEQWLRKHGTANDDGTYGYPATVAGIGPGGWDKHALANAQGQRGTPADSIARLAADVAGREVPALFTTKIVYRLYTEDVHHPNDRNDIIKRYFDGATVYWGVGLDARTQDGAEAALIIEIVTSAADALQRIADLAGDLRIAGKQISVLVTRQTVDTFEVTV